MRVLRRISALGARVGFYLRNQFPSRRGSEAAVRVGHVIFDRHSAASVDIVTPCHSITAPCTCHPSRHEFFMLYVTQPPIYTLIHTRYRHVSQVFLPHTLWHIMKSCYKKILLAKTAWLSGFLPITNQKHLPFNRYSTKHTSKMYLYVICILYIIIIW